MPTLDNCISGVFEAGNIGSSPGTVTTPQFSGYLLTAEGDRIIIQSTSPPPNTPYTLTFVSPLYALGLILLSGTQ